MKYDVEIIKDIPEREISLFEDRVVYFSAVETREFTKTAEAYPKLSGKLQDEEIASQITGGNGVYNLLAGTDYAKAVWKMSDVNWTNTKTQPQWYYSVFRRHEKTIINLAETKALKEIK